METTLGRGRLGERQPLAALGKLTVAALIGIALLLVYVQAILMGYFRPDLVTFLLITLLVAGVAATGWPWAPLLGALWSGLIIAGNREAVIYDLTHPLEASAHNFAFMAISVAIAVVGIASGIGATAQNYRGAGRALPRWYPGALASLAALCLGAILVALTVQANTGAGVSPAGLRQLPAITMRGMSFDQQQISARVGETVALRIENDTGAPHSFDVDELDVHVAAPTGKSNLILFRPARAGTYMFYCGVPGHRAAGMTGTLVVMP